MKQVKTIRAYCFYSLGYAADKVSCQELAIALMGRAIQLRDDVVEFHNAQGATLRSRGRLDEAMACHQKARALDKNCARTYYNLGCVLEIQNRLDEAVESYQHALAIDPDYACAYYGLGNVFVIQYRLGEAIAQYERAFKIDPSFFETDDKRRDALARIEKMKSEALELRSAITAKSEKILHSKFRGALTLLTVAGQREWAIGQAQEWVKDFRDNPVAAYTLAALTATASNSPSRASDSYIEDIFDNFAEEFDQILAGLGYRAPALVGETLARVLSTGGLDVLDAGCGTGLAGVFLKPWARTLTGVDLSQKMLAQAEKRGLYDQLRKSELTTYLAEHPAAFDLIASADVLIYSGDLAPALTAAAAALRPGGQIVFTVERYFDENGQGWRLLHHGRYCHSETYIRRILADCGLTVVSVTYDSLRKEAGREVDGLVVLARCDAQ